MLLSQTYAPIWKRGMAFLVDNLVIQIMASVLKLIVGMNLGWLIYAIYFVFMHYKYRQTLGKRIFNIQLDFENEDNQLIKILLREIILKPISLVSVLGWAIGFIHNKKKTLHDIVSGTIVEDISIVNEGFSFFKASAVSALVFLVLVGGGVYYTLNSESALYSFISNISRMQGFEFDNVKGSLGDDIILYGYKAERKDFDLSVREIKFNIYKSLSNMSKNKGLISVPFVSIVGVKLNLKKDFMEFASQQKKEKKDPQTKITKSKNKDSKIKEFMVEYVGINDVKIYDKMGKRLFQLNDFIVKGLTADIKNKKVNIKDLYLKNLKGHAHLKNLTANQNDIKSTVSVGIKRGLTPHILSDLTIYGDIHFDWKKKQLKNYHIMSSDKSLQVYYKDKSHNLYLNNFPLSKYFKTAKQMGISSLSAYSKSRSLFFLPMSIKGNVRLLNQTYKYQSMNLTQIGVRFVLPVMIMGEFSESVRKKPFLLIKNQNNPKFQNFLRKNFMRTPASQSQYFKNFIGAIHRGK